MCRELASPPIEIALVEAATTVMCRCLTPSRPSDGPVASGSRLLEQDAGIEHLASGCPISDAVPPALLAYITRRVWSSVYTAFPLAFHR